MKRGWTDSYIVIYNSEKIGYGSIKGNRKYYRQGYSLRILYYSLLQENIFNCIFGVSEYFEGGFLGVPEQRFPAHYLTLRIWT